MIQHEKANNNSFVFSVNSKYNTKWQKPSIQMDMHKFLSIIILVLFCSVSSVKGQDSLAIGEWESHLPYTSGNYISQSSSKIIYSTLWSLFTIDKEDFSIEFYDKINLLTDVGVLKHKYDDEGEQLILIYNDSNIDIIKGTEVINIPDIKNNSDILGDKKIYNVSISDNRRMFISCGFGVVEFDLESYEFGFTCFTDIPVYNTHYYDNNIIAATEDGVYKYDLDLHDNPSDFQLWDHLGQEYGLPEIYPATDLLVWKEHLYMSTGEDLWKTGKELSFDVIYSTKEDNEIAFLNSSDGELMVGVAWEYNVSKVLFFKEDDLYVQGHHECSNQINFAELDQFGRLWYADRTGAIRYAENKIYPCDAIDINAPYSNNISDVDTKGDKVFIASGGVDPSYTYIYRRDGFYIWNGEKWKIYNENEYPVFRDRDMYDFFRILPHPESDKVFVGTYHRGILELNPENDEMAFYDQTNSTLRGKTGDESRERVSGMAFDQQMNLWVSNFGAPKPLSVFTSSGEWRSFNVQSGKDLRDISIDQSGNKWIIIDREAEGFLVIDEGDLDDPSDDRQRVISKSNSNLQSNKINAIEVDLDGDVWVGTAAGPVVFECGSEVFDSGCRGNRRQTELEGIGAYLLDDVNITCIETDGANRKWFGSESGIFVQSATGEEQIAHFTKENSPLFDNTIIDLAYNDLNGSMLIATSKGLMSFRTITSTGGDKHRGDIYAFPNPVRPEYNGLIAIKGFARDSNIKITDINGQLIHETTAQGGQAIWDGFDYNGRRAASGVYLVFASTTDDFEEPKTIVTKILLVK